jgi:hypothetical protein
MGRSSLWSALRATHYAPLSFRADVWYVSLFGQTFGSGIVYAHERPDGRVADRPPGRPEATERQGAVP